MKKTLSLLALVLVVVVAVLAVRAARFETRQPAPSAKVALDIPITAAAEHLAAALTFPTISHQDRSLIASEAFLGLHDFLAATYPLVHQNLERETVSDLSLLFTWRGSDPDLQPALLMGHMDVVPVIPGTEEDWIQPPFGGVIADDHIWGRGAMDDKSTVISLLEAVEALLAEGFQPQRTWYLAFGHDEEVGGPEGAGVISQLLASRLEGELAFVLDEGGIIFEEFSGGGDRTTALIGIAEKGFASLELTVEATGGHSSMPPASTAVGILSTAITRLEAAPFPTRLDGATRRMMEFIGPELPFGRKLLMANLWLFGPVVKNMMATDPTSAAMVRTTTAATMFNAGVKDNVLPISARAIVNFRILPGDTIESVHERVVEIIDDERVAVEIAGTAHDPSPVSDPDSPAFALIAQSLLQAVPGDDLLITPYLVVGGTDAKYYAESSSNVFRFLAVRISKEDMGRVHGTNERLSLENLATSIGFYHQLIRNGDAAANL